MIKVIEYHNDDRNEHWLAQIRECEWGGAAFLYELLSEKTFFDTLGAKTKLLLLTDGDELLSFCTYAERDDIPDTKLTPWIGFVYTFPQYRGHRYFGLLLKEAERLAENDAYTEIYVSTNHDGLYEKYGFEYYGMMIDIHGEDSRIYVKRLGRSI